MRNVVLIICLLSGVQTMSQSDTWIQRTDIGSTSRREAVGFSIDTKGYYGTGFDTALRKAFWEYDMVSNAWTQKADFGATARKGAVGLGIGEQHLQHS